MLGKQTYHYIVVGGFLTGALRPKSAPKTIYDVIFVLKCSPNLHSKEVYTSRNYGSAWWVGSLGILIHPQVLSGP